MLTGERRPVSARRGMTVLGKIPAVPKPINLPSQRLENRGLDPNVEIVPRGSVSWGTTGRSPPSSTSPWGNSAQSTSPPVGTGPWGGVPPRPATPGNSGLSSATSGLTSGNSGGPWGANVPRPSSAGSGARPSSAGSLRQNQEPPVVSTWGPATARPTSASGVLGQAQPQASVVRPRSAETRTASGQGPVMTRFSDQTSGQTAPPPGAWGGAGTARKLTEEPHQPSRFQLTRVDFPTLGSEKNPDLRPQQNRSGTSPPELTSSIDEFVSPAEERPPSGPLGPQEALPPPFGGAYGGQERMPDSWRRDPRPHGGHPGLVDGGWHNRDGPPPMQPYGGGQQIMADTWRRETGHLATPGSGPADDNWRRGGPPVGPYGHPNPGRFQPEPAGYMHQQRYGPGPGPMPYGRGGGPGPGGYGRHGDMYGNAAPFGRSGGAPPRPGPLMGPGMYNGPYDNFYGPPGPGYGNMDERETMMLGMNGPPGMYGNFPQGPPEPFGRYPHGGPGPGPRHMANTPGMNRDRSDPLGYEGEGYRDGLKYKDNSNFKDGGGYKDGGGFNKDSGRSYQEPGESRRVGQVANSSLTTEVQRPSSSEISRPSSSDMQRPSSRGGLHGTHRDWGAAASSDEPMDFSKPVFEEEILSASPSPSHDPAPSGSSVNIDNLQMDGGNRSAEQVRIVDLTADVGLPVDKARGLVDTRGTNKDILFVQTPKSNDMTTDDAIWNQKDADMVAGPHQKSRGEDTSLVDAKEQVIRKAPRLEISEASDKRWGKNARIPVQTTREPSFGRDSVFSPHDVRALGSRKDRDSAASSVTRPGAHTPSPNQSVGSVSNSRLAALSVPQGQPSSSSPESVLSEEVASPTVHEKHAHFSSHASDPTSPSGSDGQKNSEKVRILKRVGDGGPDSPHCDSVNASEVSQTDVHALVAGATEPHLKDDTKSRSKAASSHDGEKEWRPKAPIADTAVEVSQASTAVLQLPSTPAVSNESSGLPGGATVAAEKPSLSPGNPSSGDSYDYEAQRARMKEIAAQRAIQLRKEEEERIKEQKAKALAKLEELNRRSIGAPVSQVSEEATVDEAPDEPTIVTIQPQEPEVVVLEVSIDETPLVETSSAGGGVSTPRGTARSGRNEHGKRERVGERKSNGRSREDHRVKISSGEHRELSKGRLSTSSSQGKMEPPIQTTPRESPPPQPLLPSPSSIQGSNVPLPESPAELLPETSSVGDKLHHQVPKLHDPRHRGKQFSSQQKHVARQFQSSSAEAEQPPSIQEITAESTDKIVDWPVATRSTLDLESKEMSTKLGTTGENVTAVRKRKMKTSGRSKQKHEGLTISTDSTSSVDPNQGWNVDLSSSNESGTDVGKPASKTAVQSGSEKVAKVVPALVAQKQSVPEDSKPELAVAEQSASIESAGSDGGSFRSNGGGSDGGSLRSNGDLPSRRGQRKTQPARRASARERATSQDVRVENKPHGGEGMIWAPVRSPSGSHPVALKGGFGSDGLAPAESAGDKKEEISVVQQTGRARRAELERYTPKPVVKQQAQQQELQQQQAVPSVVQHQGVETSNASSSSELPQSLSISSEIKFGSEALQADSSIKPSRSHTSAWRQRASGSERTSAPKDPHQGQHSDTRTKDSQSLKHSDSTEAGGKVLHASHNQTQQSHHRSRGQPNASSEQSRPGSSHQSRADVANVVGHQSSTPVVEKEKEKQQPDVTPQGRSSHSNVPVANAAPTEREPKSVQEGVTPYQPPRPGSSQKNRGLESDGQNSHEHPKSQRVNASHSDRQQHGAPGKFEREHSSHDRTGGHHQSRSHSFRNQGPSGSHDKDLAQPQPGTNHSQRSGPSVQSNVASDSVSREKDQQNSSNVGVGQGKPTSKPLHGQTAAPVLTEKEQNRAEHVGAHQPRSPARQRARQHAVSHEKDQTVPGSHAHQQPRYRQSGHEREHHRDVSNAVHHQQQHKGSADGNWQQSGGVASHERTQSSSDNVQSHEHSTRSTSHKSQATFTASGERDHGGPRQQSRPETQNKQQLPVAVDTQKQQQYQPVSQSQKVQQHSGSHNPNPKLDNTHKSSHWNGERGGSPPFRGREHGHPRRGRFGGRFGGGSTGRGGEVDRREQLPKQRLPIDAAGGAVPSQVGG